MRAQRESLGLALEKKMVHVFITEKQYQIEWGENRNQGGHERKSIIQLKYNA